MTHVHHPLNWTAGYSLVLAACVNGTAIGLFFHFAHRAGMQPIHRANIARLPLAV